MADNKLVKFESEIQSLTGGDILHAEIATLSKEETVQAYAIVKYLEDRLKARRTELRDRIVEDPEISAAGKTTASGGSSGKVAGHKVVRKKQTKRFKNASKIRQVMEERGLSESDIFDQVPRTVVDNVVNPSKIEKLVETGRLTEEDVNSFHVIQWTVVVSPSDALEVLLESSDSKTTV